MITELCQQVELQFLKILSEEGLKDDRVFRALILKRTKVTGKQLAEIQKTIDFIFKLGASAPDLEKRFNVRTNVTYRVGKRSNRRNIYILTV